jgi:glycosyltransferase involved in cell wall biosynthesis
VAIVSEEVEDNHVAIVSEEVEDNTIESVKPTNPVVCVLTPTCNKQDCIPIVIHQFHKQEFCVEDKLLIILDDTPNKPLSDDFFETEGCNMKNVVYIHSDKKQNIHAKRQRLKDIALNKYNASYCVCMDDDDIYHPEYIKTSVGILANGDYHVVSCKSLLFFNSQTKNVHFHTFKKFKYFACHGTIGFTREYGQTHNYSCDPNRENFFEEYEFTNSFSEKVYHMDPHKTIIVMCGQHNTVSKKQYLVSQTMVSKKNRGFLLTDFGVIGDPIMCKAFL